MLGLAKPFPPARFATPGFPSAEGKLYHPGKDSIRRSGVERQGPVAADSKPPYRNEVLT